jgi:glycosyltransferase involved in cell wall biosynthesis
VKVSLIVPIFNNRANAEAFCLEFINAQLLDTSLTLVDNGSIESESLKHLENLAPDKITVVSLKVNAGFGGGIQAGLGSAQSEWVIWLPGNMKVLPSRLGKFIEFVKTQQTQTFVKAIRGGRPLIPRSKTLLASIAQSVVARTWLFDTGGTPTAIHKANYLLKELLDGPKDYSFESYALFIAKLNGLQVRRVNVIYGDRLYGTSHWQFGLMSELRLVAEILLSIPRWRAKLLPQEKRKTIA